MSLLEAAREDVALAIRQQVDLQCFEQGLSSGGRGKTSAQRLFKNHKEDLKCAQAYGMEV